MHLSSSLARTNVQFISFQYCFQVLKVLSHVNQRYKAVPNWKLPTQALLTLLQALPKANVLTCNFTVGYLLSSLSRETTEVRRATLLTLMTIFPNLSDACQQQVICAFVCNLPLIRIRGDPERRAKEFAFISTEVTRSAFLNFCSDLLLWTPRVTSSSGANDTTVVQNNLDASATVSPGHSIDSQNAIKVTSLAAIQSQLPDASNVVQQIASLSLQQLTERKCQAISFMRENVDLFSDTDLYIAALIASTDSLNDVQSAGEDLHRKISTKEVIENPKILKKMFQLFLGDSADSTQSNTAAGTSANTNALRTPASLATRTRILEIFAKSRSASSSMPQAFQTLISALFASHNANHPKVQLLALQFAQDIVRNISETQIALLGPALLKSLSKFMKTAGGGSGQSRGPTASQLESLQISNLHSISALGRRSPKLFANDVELIEELINDLKSGKLSVVLTSATQEALTSICPSSSNISSEAIKTRLKNLLGQLFEKGTDSKSDNAMQVDNQSINDSTSIAARFVAQFYANRCFPFSDAFCRYINLLGTSDSNAQVSQEAKLGLSPFSVVSNEIVPLKPSKSQSISSLSSSSNNLSSSSAQESPENRNLKTSSSMDVDKDYKPEASGEISNTSIAIEWPSFADMTQLVKEKLSSGLTLTAPTYLSTITFLRNILHHHRKYCSGLVNSTANAATSESFGNKKSSSMAFYFELLQDSIIIHASNNTSYSAAEIYLETMQLKAIACDTKFSDFEAVSTPTMLSIDMNSALSSLPSSLLSGSFKPETARLVSRIVGLLSLEIDENRRLDLLDTAHVSILANKSSISRDSQIGAMYLASSLSAACLRRNLLDAKFGGNFAKISDIATSLHGALQAAVISRVGSGLAGNALLLSALDSIGAIARWSAEISEVSEDKKETLLQTVISQLSSTDSSIVIASAYCIGNMCLGNRKLSTDANLLKSMLSTFSVKSEEAHFSIGEAFSMIADGWFSNASSDQLIHSEKEEAVMREKQKNEKEFDAMSHILHVTLQEYFLSSRPDTRMAAAIWLLTILKNCGENEKVKNQLKSIQSGFQQLLSDSNEIMQEVAGKALSLVYELGDESTRKELVDTLVNALQKGSGGFKVTADTEIFAPGAVGTTPSGDKLTTYRELVTLAAEMNQPDLIYKFMQLSSHNALWNSKKGAAFATGELAQRAKQQIAPHLPLLIPKLYRSSFDPNPKIAHSMHSILATLVPSDLKGTLQRHIREILKDLIENCVDPQWRTREACCNALADILAAREWNDVKDELQLLWDRCFRVLDDIKESVRKAAESFKKALSNLTLRLCDPAYTNREHGKVALDIALPHLMAKGLVSPVKDVRAISLSMIQKIARVASFLLKPHVSELVPVLLSSLGSLESAAQLNYLEQHSSSFGISGDMLDEARVSLAKNSPVHATIDTCIRQVDSTNIEFLVPKLSLLLSADHHVATRTGAANVITTLALTKPDVARLAAHKFMLALKKGINARAPIVRKTYGYAMGQLSKCAKKKTVEIIVTSLLESYKKSTPEESDLRAAIAEALFELSKASAIPVETLTPATTDSSDQAISAATATSENGDEISSPVSAPQTPSNESSQFNTSSSSAMAVDPSEEKPPKRPSSAAITEGKAAVPVLAPLLHLVVPVVFIARFDAKEETSKVFNKIWEECGASLALYVKETVLAFGAAFDASSWQMKQQGAKAVAKFAESLNLSQFEAEAPALLALLLNGLKGRTWEGKESLLAALSKLVVCAIDLWAKSDSKVHGEQKSAADKQLISPEDLIKTILGEIARKSLEYKKAAIVCLVDVLTAFNKAMPTLNTIEKVKEPLIECATTVHTSEDDDEKSSKQANKNSSLEAQGSSAGASNSEKKDEESAISRSIRLMSIQALCAAFPSENKNDLQAAHFASLADLLRRVFRTAIAFSVKVSVLNYLKTLVSKVSPKDWDQVVQKETLHQILENIIIPALSDPKYSVVRTAACNALQEILSAAEHSPNIEQEISDIDSAVAAADKLGTTPVSSEKLLSLILRLKSQ